MTLINYGYNRFAREKKKTLIANITLYISDSVGTIVKLIYDKAILNFFMEIFLKSMLIIMQFNLNFINVVLLWV